MLRWIFRLVLLILVATAAALVYFADELANWRVKGVLAQRELDSLVSYRRVEISAKRLLLHDLRVGDWFRAERVELHFSPQGLWSGHYQRIQVHSGKLLAEKTKHGLEIPGLEALIAALERSAEPGGSENLPMDEVLAEQIKVRVVVPSEPLSPYPELILEGRGHCLGPKLKGQARLRDTSGQLSIAANGDMDFSSLNGSAALKLEPVTFRRGGLQPQQLYRPLDDLLEDSRGIMSADASFQLTGGKLSAQGTLVLQNAETKLAGLPLKGISTRIQFDDLLSLRSAARQELKVAQLALASKQLVDGAVIFSLLDSRRIHIHQSSWALGDGSVSVGERVIDLDRSDAIRLTFLFNDVALMDLSPLDADALQVSGRVSGALPILIADGGLRIDEGALASSSGGVIRYRPSFDPKAQEPQFQMLLTLLENFYYDTVSIELRSPMTGEVQAIVQVKGQNPDWEDGQPVVLNIRLRGDLMQSVLQGLKLYYVPQTLIEESK